MSKFSMRHDAFSTISERSNYSYNSFKGYIMCIALFIIGLFFGLFFGSEEDEINLIKAELKVLKKESVKMESKLNNKIKDINNSLRVCKSNTSYVNNSLKICKRKLYEISDSS